jgi:hypothetical protein
MPARRTPELAASIAALPLPWFIWPATNGSAALNCAGAVVALDHALMHLCLSRMGMADARFDRLLATALSSRGAAGRETPCRIAPWSSSGCCV